MVSPMFAETVYLSGSVSADFFGILTPTGRQYPDTTTNFILTGDTTIFVSSGSSATGATINKSLDGPYNLKIIGNINISAPIGKSSPIASLRIEGDCSMDFAISTIGVFAVSGTTKFYKSFTINSYSFSTQQLFVSGVINVSMNLVRDVTIPSLYTNYYPSAIVIIAYGGSASVFAPSASSVSAYPTIKLLGPSAVASSKPNFLNISTRGLVTSAVALNAGFVIGGSGTKRILIRSAGPALTQFGVNNAISDPAFEVFDSLGKSIAKNDNWDSSIASSFGLVGAFPFPVGSKDAALALTVAAGSSYTVIVNGVGAVSGESLVEVYELP